ncbi:MAG: hypothetical protein IJQ05_01895 [Bacteroidaceae bacterium]|nr:hypothetical protein [Bacteroidaceae bacterium]
MKKLLTLLLLAVGFSTGAWALEQDGEGGDNNGGGGGNLGSEVKRLKH